MTPLEKAQQLKESFNNSLTAKDCCLVALEEIISVIDPETFLMSWLYWKEVKKHIEEL
jgi:hypothetical protein